MKKSAFEQRPQRSCAQLVVCCRLLSPLIRVSEDAVLVKSSSCPWSFLTGNASVMIECGAVSSSCVNFVCPWPAWSTSWCGAQEKSVTLPLWLMNVPCGPSFSADTLENPDTQPSIWRNSPITLPCWSYTRLLHGCFFSWKTGKRDHQKRLRGPQRFMEGGSSILCTCLLCSLHERKSFIERECCGEVRAPLSWPLKQSLPCFDGQAPWHLVQMWVVGFDRCQHVTSCTTWRCTTYLILPFFEIL